ncbi:MAG TPA: serine/threonine-protein kinase [Rudaea sp.]|jgi:non-specific serine/threonine protein kinase/serine/threonine-protein kinase|nr:serine/threonine-protein kinase [Rudaea sp.]
MSAPKNLQPTVPDQPTVLDIESGVDDGSHTLSPGQRVGPYRITRLLGEGGMGAVYLAEQLEPIQRAVALKLIRGQLQGGLAEAYFMVERQALARMDHPAIAKVYDAGTTPQGHPFFAMEWIDGPPLNAYWATRDGDRRELLDLFIHICMGVQHAHQRGVIHRDLKPSNVLIADVDGKPSPKIIDFGIAIGASQTTGGESALMQTAGTRGYMSPEQLRGKISEIDVRTDIYALGVMLLELLLPTQTMDNFVHGGFDNRDLHAALLVSLGEAKDAPADIVRGVSDIPVELRWALARATDPDRTRRYESAQALADDLRRYLDRFPLRAVPNKNSYRLRCFVVRNRGPILAACLIAVALIAGATAAIIGMVNARNAAIRANIEAEKSRQTSDFLADILSGVRPEEARDLDKTLMRKILDNAAAQAQKKLVDQPEALAQIEATIGNSYYSISDYKPSLAHTVRAFNLAKDKLGHDALQTLRIERQYAQELMNVGKFPDADAMYADNIATLTRLRGADDKDTLKSRSDLAELLIWEGKLNDAEKIILAIEGPIVREFGPTSDEALNIGIVHAEVLVYMGRYEEAEPIYRKLIDEHEKVFGPEHPKTLDVLNRFAIMNLEANRFAEGEKILSGMLPICEKIYGPNHAFTIEIVSNLAGALRQQGTPEKIAASGPYYERALAETRKRYGEKNQNTVMATHNYGNYLLDVGKTDEAIATQRHALEFALQVFGPVANVTGEVHFGLGKSLLKAHQYPEAEKELLAAIDEKEKDFGKTHWRLREYITPLIETYKAMGKTDQATQWTTRLNSLPPKPTAST